MRKVVILLILSLGSVLAHADAVWTHAYDFTTGSTADLAGSGATISLGNGTFSSAGYSFAAGQGVTLTNAASGAYSLHMVFSYTPVNGWGELVMLSNGGLWLDNNVLNFYAWTGDIANTTMTPGTTYDVIITHQDDVGPQYGTQIYLGGKLVASTYGYSSQTSGTIGLMVNNPWGQTVGGTIQRIDIYSGALTQSQVTLVDDDNIPQGYAPSTVPEPASMLLFGSGLALVAPLVRRFRR